MHSIHPKPVVLSETNIDFVKDDKDLSWFQSVHPKKANGKDDGNVTEAHDSVNLAPLNGMHRQNRKERKQEDISECVHLYSLRLRENSPDNTDAEDDKAYEISQSSVKQPEDYTAVFDSKQWPYSQIQSSDLQPRSDSDCKSESTEYKDVQSTNKTDGEVIQESRHVLLVQIDLLNDTIGKNPKHSLILCMVVKLLEFRPYVYRKLTFKSFLIISAVHIDDMSIRLSGLYMAYKNILHCK